MKKNTRDTVFLCMLQQRNTEYDASVTAVDMPSTVGVRSPRHNRIRSTEFHTICNVIALLRSFNGVNVGALAYICNIMSPNYCLGCDWVFVHVRVRACHTHGTMIF